jgi:hypothetical protein
MRSNFEEKRNSRIDRYEALARKFAGESESRLSRFNALANAIPMGQPILVGHHSERRHRRDLEKMENNMRQAVELQNKAEHYQSRIKAAEDNTAISSDDPDALQKLTDKLARLQEYQEHMKRINALHGKYLKNPKALDDIDLPEEWKEKIRTYVPEYSWLKHPYAPYKLTNNSGNMATVRKRIERLQYLNTQQDKETLFGDIRIKENATENRIQIFFPGKPEEKVREELKHNGFRWAPSVGAWQSFYSTWAGHMAKQIVEGIVK